MFVHSSIDLSIRPSIHQVEGALEVLQYNLDKARFDAEMSKKEASSSTTNGEGAWIPCVGHYDSIRSLHALLSIVNALNP